MPKGTQQARVTHIEDLGAEVIVTDLNYDDSVELAMKVAKERNGTIILDIAYEGYEEIPTWVCQGYCLLAEEACNTMEKEGPPTHVFLQVGVGSFATSVAGYMVNRYPENPPKFISIEPYEAACAYKSAVEGKFATVGGDMNTMMAGLACGVPSTLAYPILRDHFSAHTMMSEECPANGMRLLKELGIESGECGGSGYGLLHHLSKGSEKAMQFRQ
jgi:diaminopropionate ammonia-lyase